MEKEKKGLFGRLLDFWKEKVGMGETDSIGFWKEAEPLEKHFSEIGPVDVLNQQETRKVFWEEKADGGLEGKEQDNSVLEKQKKIVFAEAKEKEHLQISEETEDTERKQRVNLFSAEFFREGRKAEAEEGVLGKPFLWEMPMEEQEKQSIIPVMAEPVQEKESVLEERQEKLERETTKREELQAEPTVDIEKLMRQMTKKLWEERESCGRRLR